ncbi:hypothetical protein Nepgr_014531 [Nepenthes gracilis]|uniref:Uncharacterized protein n=1 Tax=Nepenthes gracilis TaxID=150966 RepID=A0AAD3XQK3_NEPGR|nr:hypothetical protein Nepgr_014531 [Nepenthes gracilis]
MFRHTHRQQLSKTQGGGGSAFRHFRNFTRKPKKRRALTSLPEKRKPERERERKELGREQQAKRAPSQVSLTTQHFQDRDREIDIDTLLSNTLAQMKMQRNVVSLDLRHSVEHDSRKFRHTEEDERWAEDKTGGERILPWKLGLALELAGKSLVAATEFFVLFLCIRRFASF